MVKVKEGNFYGIWATARKEYIKEVEPEFYRELCESNELEIYLMDFQETYEQKSDKMIEEMEKQENVTEELKQQNAYEWMKRSIRIQGKVRNILMREIMGQLP